MLYDKSREDMYANLTIISLVMIDEKRRVMNFS